MKNAANAVPEGQIPQNQNNTAGDIVRFPVSDWQMHPLTKDAHDLYYTRINEYVDLAGRNQFECRRHYIPLGAVKDLAAALERQVTVDEMNLLIGFDGESVTCKVSERQFQPVWWVLLTDTLLRAIKVAKGVTEESLRAGRAMTAGMFFPDPAISSEEVYPVSGVPFFWTKSEESKRAFWSPFCKMWEINRKNYGDTRSVAEAIIADRKSRKAEQAKVRDGLNRMEEIFQNGRRDRRQTFSPKK